MRKFLLMISLGCVAVGMACTSALVAPVASKNGHLLMWKHRDTGAADNFLERVAPRHPGDRYAYVGLFNGGDSLLTEAWMGVNEAGLAVMNTASYNLAPDTARVKDREGVVMAQALARCASVAEFQALLDSLIAAPEPAGVQANFAAADSHGNAAYFETYDNGYTVYPLADAPDGVLLRTNYSVSGDPNCGGMGYVRCDNARYLLQPFIDARSIEPATFTDYISRSFYHSLAGRDMSDDATEWLVDQDFIPRRISTASIVIELGGAEGPVLWTVLGYPPVGETIRATIDDLPDDLRPTLPGWHAPANARADQRKQAVFPLHRGNGQRYIYLPAIKGNK